jgi:hypothetical protein
MVEYICNKCKKTYRKKYNYDKHVGKKYSCILKDNKLECEYCGFECNRKGIMNNHIKYRCLIKKDLDNDDNINNTNEIYKLKKQIKELQNVITNQQIINSNNTTNNNTANITNNQTINNKYMIVNFGKEDLDRLTLNDKREILNSSYGAILKCAMKINFNPYIPEQNNIFITNPKSDYAYKYDNGKFLAIKTNDLLDELIYHRMNDVRELVDQNNTLKIGNNKIERVNNLLNKIEEEKLDDINNLKKDLKLTLFNENDIAVDNKKKIENDKKTIKN